MEYPDSKRRTKSVVDTESVAMKLAGMLGFKKLRWSLRRLHCPVAKSALVLEVGGGGNPYPRANILLDAMETSIERIEQQLIRDRPLVLGICEEMPFKDKAFDFVIASHVLEHSDDPEKFLSELMRVAKAGYIETPEGWFEKMCPFTYHRLEVSNVDGRLLIKKKPNWKPDEISVLYEKKLAGDYGFARFMRVNPDLNHMRFYWTDRINYEIVNPGVDASWPYPTEALKKAPLSFSMIQGLRNKYLSFRRWMFSQSDRNRSLSLADIIRCPTCHNQNTDFGETAISCAGCGASYEVSHGVPKLFPNEARGFNKSRVT